MTTPTATAEPDQVHGCNEGLYVPATTENSYCCEMYNHWGVDEISKGESGRINFQANESGRKCSHR